MTTQQAAVIYCRASVDRTGHGQSVAAQERAARKLCRDKGFTVVDVVSESGVSATRSKARAGFDRMLEMLARGDAQVVVTTELSRLSRRWRDLGRLLTLVEERKVRIVTVSGELDTSTAAGRLVVSILASVASAEAEQTRERTMRGLDAAAAAGRSHGGRRPYGYQFVKGKATRTVVESEAAEVRTMARKLLTGGTLHGIVNDLHVRGVTTSTGKDWRTQTVRLLLTSPGAAGLRQHEDTLVPAIWPAILTRDTWDAVGRLLADPTRSTSPGPKAAHLLSGIALCAGCEQPLAAKRAPRKQVGFVYRCIVQGCPRHSTVSERHLDDFVAEVVIGRLSRRDAVRLFASPVDTRHRSELLAERDDLDRRDAEAAGMFAAGSITGAQLSTVTLATTARREQLDLELGTLLAATPIDGLPVGQDKVRAWWKSLDMARKRAVVSVLMTVTVSQSSTPGARVLDPTRVGVDWRSI
jgi:DNA invertase Pin-like site-specific DNA recombinase